MFYMLLLQIQWTVFMDTVSKISHVTWKLFCDVVLGGVSLFHPGTSDLMQGSGVEAAQLGLARVLMLLANCRVQHSVGCVLFW